METTGVDRNKTERTILIIACALAILLALFFSVAILPKIAPFLIIDGNLGSLIFGIPLFVVGCLFLIICLHN